MRQYRLTYDDWDWERGEYRADPTYSITVVNVEIEHQREHERRHNAVLQELIRDYIDPDPRGA